MGTGRESSVQINRRTIILGDVTFTLSSVARLQIVRLPTPSSAGDGDGCLASGASLLGALAVGLLTAGAYALFRSNDVIAYGASLATFIAVGAGMWVYAKTIPTIPPRYALVLETVGHHIASISSTDRSQLGEIATLIQAALEDGAGPANTHNYNGTFTFSFDTYNASGDGSTGRMG